MLALLVATRIGLSLGALLVVGMATHAGLVAAEDAARRRMMRLAAAAVAILVLAIAARIALLNAQLGGSLSDAFDSDLFAWSWQALGPATLAALAGAVLILTAWILSSRMPGARIAGAAGTLAVSASFALTGHVSGADTSIWLQALLGLHVLIAGFWIAAPLTLWPARQIDDASLTVRLRRFSLVATAAVPFMLAAGGIIALQLAGGVSGLISTAYGNLLLLKLAVTVIALGAGAVNRQLVTSRMVTNPATARRWLRITLSIEATAFAAAIVLVSLATTIWPPAHM